MAYLLNMHGKWLPRSGKVLFDYPEQLEAYLKGLIHDAIKALKPYMQKRRALSKINLSYTVITIEDDSPLSECFLASTIIDQEIYNKKDKDESTTQPAQETLIALEGTNQDRDGNPERNSEGSSDDSSRYESDDLQEWQEV